MSDSESPMVTTDPANAVPRVFAAPHEVAPAVFMYPAFVNTYALRTDEGLMIVDPGLAMGTDAVREAVREWSDAPLRVAVYTHGHFDHAFGLRAFLDAGERPEIVAQENCLARFERYRLTNGWNASINKRQFGSDLEWPMEFDWPTLTFRDSLVQRLGGLELHLHSAKGETDDACWVWVPERKQLFTGDLVIWAMPNCGNPQKVQRYPVDWADALETMAGLGAEWLFPGHGLVVHGEHAIRTMLTETAEFLRHLLRQVLERMNRGEKPDDIFHAVEPHADLAQRPFLNANYDHPKFIVRNLLRLWGGWWNGNPADLLPAPGDEQARVIAELAGGIDGVIAKARSILDDGDPRLAAHLAEWAVRADPDSRPAQELRRDVYEKRLGRENSLMVQGIFREAMNESRRALGEEPVVFDFKGLLARSFETRGGTKKKA